MQSSFDLLPSNYYITLPFLLNGKINFELSSVWLLGPFYRITIIAIPLCNRVFRSIPDHCPATPELGLLRVSQFGPAFNSSACSHGCLLRKIGPQAAYLPTHTGISISIFHAGSGSIGSLVSQKDFFVNSFIHNLFWFCLHAVLLWLGMDFSFLHAFFLSFYQASKGGLLLPSGGCRSFPSILNKFGSFPEL